MGLTAAANGEVRSPAGIILPRTFETFDAPGDGAVYAIDQSWTTLVGSFSRVSDTAEVQSSGNNEALGRMNLDLGSPNHFIEALITQTGNPGGTFSTCGLIVRKDSSATRTFYMIEIANNISPGVVGAYKCVGGSYTGLTGTGHATPHLTEPFWIRAEVEGSALRLYQDGVLLWSGSDGSIAGGSYVGLRSFRNSDPKTRYAHVAAGPL